jgi:hypothetical protein
MSLVLEDAVRTVLSHGRSQKEYVLVPQADFAALARSCPSRRSVKPASGTVIPQRDPAYEREMRQLFANAELDP